MQRREFLQSAAAAAAASPPEPHACDVFVYGSTPGGVGAAVEAARRGARVILACPKRRPGGMAASGLSTTDAVRPQLFGGLVAEFVAGVRAAYVRMLGESSAWFKLVRDGWFYEPSVAEEVFRRLLEKEQARLRWLPAHWLVSAAVSGRRVISAELEDAKGARLRVAARTFIDGTYEGDLAGAAKAPCRVGAKAAASSASPSPASTT